MQLGLQTWNQTTGFHAAGAFSTADDPLHQAGGDQDESLAELSAKFPQLEILHQVGRGGTALTDPGILECAAQ